MKNQFINRQNEELMLKVQLAAGKLYNQAEIYNYVVWLFCLINTSLVFFDDVLLWIPVVISILAFFLQKELIQNIKDAAKLKSFFDNYVLDLETDLRVDEKDYLVFLSNKIYNRSMKKFKRTVECNNLNLLDGKRDWYENLMKSDSTTKEQIQFSCQNENIRWTQELFYKKIWVSQLLFHVLFLLLLIVANYENFEIVSFCVASLYVKVYEDLTSWLKYTAGFARVKLAKELVGKETSRENVNLLQREISILRTVPYIGVNKFHKIFAKSIRENSK